MELLYVWIDNFRDGLIEEQGFNFDNCFKYQLRCNQDNKKFELHIKSNPNYLEDFFKPESHYMQPTAKINNITAIVGQNGAGKSSIIDFLKEKFGTDSSEENEEQIEKYLYIVREYKNDEILHYIYFSEKMDVVINIHKETNYSYQVKNDKGFNCNLKQTDLIYFSNIFDKKEEFSNGKLLNISTNLLAGSSVWSSNAFLVGEGSDFKFQEVKRQLQFICMIQNNLENFKLPFNVPTKIDLFYENGRNPLSGEDYTNIEEEKDIFSSIQQIYFSTTPRGGERFNRSMNREGRIPLVRFARCILGHLYKELRHEKWEDKIKDIEFSLLEVGVQENDYLALIRGIDEFAWILKNRNQKLDELVKMLHAIAILMNIFYEDYLYRTEVLRGRLRHKISVNIEEFRRFSEVYENSCINYDFLNFSWRNLSSGENALLNIYSRFYFVSKRWELTRNPENDLIILIDEGEVYLHPHWQGKLLNSLIEYFPIVFSNITGRRQRNIQLILTSNSPFVVSDLPSTNIIFLKKEEGKTLVTDGLEDYYQTFAANIHSLLAHSFFMEDGVTGAFAKRKINEIVHLLVKEDINTILQNEQKIERTINSIGEPLIRNKLSQMLNDRLSIRMINVNNEIQELRSRLEKLEELEKLKKLEKRKNDNN